MFFQSSIVQFNGARETGVPNKGCECIGNKRLNCNKPLECRPNSCFIFYKKLQLPHLLTAPVEVVNALAAAPPPPPHHLLLVTSEKESLPPAG